MKKLHTMLLAGTTTVMMIPTLALAQEKNLGKIGEFFSIITGFINDILIPLVFAIALLVFLWGVFNYFILGGGDETKQEAGRSLMLYAIIGFVVMISIFGIVNLIANGLGFDGKETLIIPDVPKQNTD